MWDVDRRGDPGAGEGDGSLDNSHASEDGEEMGMKTQFGGGKARMS